MSKVCIIFGGSGYIGKNLIRHFLNQGRFEKIYNLDLQDSGVRNDRLENVIADVRLPINMQIAELNPETSWIFNLAALCREPGSQPQEYFDTNIKGAENIISFAEKAGCKNLFFTSTMSTYGRAERPTPEDSCQYPETPYGISKLVAEKIHLVWRAKNDKRRLIICRPSVIFGPEDVGNILRMIKAIDKGYFFYPGNPDITKAYGYIYGLLESIDFTMARNEEKFIIYNYAEHPLLNLREMVGSIKGLLGKHSVTLRLPIGILLFGSIVVQHLAEIIGKNSPIHPIRVKKMAYPTNIFPGYLLNAGFIFRFPFDAALEHWRSEAPHDFKF